MITVAEQPSRRAQALALSVLLHGSLLVLAVALVPAWRGAPWGSALREAAGCLRPCAMVTIRLLTRAAAASFLPARRPLPNPKPATGAAPRRNVAAVPAGGAAILVQPSRHAGDVAPVTFSLHPPTKVVAIPPAQPPSAVAVQDVTLHVRPEPAPGNWGSHFDSPALRDGALYDDLMATLPKGGSVTITVDDHGRATDVRIVAPGLDAATLAKLRERLLAASYAPVERNGVAFEGKLKIAR